MNAIPANDAELIAQGRNYAYGFTRNFHDAEDLAQQAWLKLKLKYQEVKDRGLLFRAIRNLFIDGTRRAKIVRFEALENHEYALGNGGGNGFGRKGDIDSILGILSSAEQLCMRLAFIDGFTATEIAERTGMPRGTILSHTHRAKKKLHAAFGHELSLDSPDFQAAS